MYLVFLLNGSERICILNSIVKSLLSALYFEYNEVFFISDLMLLHVFSIDLILNYIFHQSKFC